MISLRKRPGSPSHNPSSSEKRSKNSNINGQHSVDNDESNKENAITFDCKQKSSSYVSSVESEEDGHLIFKLGDVLDQKYSIIGILGKGTFGQVIHVNDMEMNRSIAIKVVRNITRYRRAAENEITLLKYLGNRDPSSVHLCVKMLSSFFYNGHACMVFEKFGLNVHAFLERNHCIPYDMDEIRHIANQLCYSVKFLHSLKVTHTDLKPENIVLVNSDYNVIYDKTEKVNVKRLKKTDIRLIDFGCAVLDNEYHPKIVTTRNFRAPEVILQLGWTQSCDVWSIGCILFEMYFGKVLFKNSDDVGHLGMMELILGEIPSRMVKATKTTYFIDGMLDWSKSEMDPHYIKQICKPLMMYRRKKYANHNKLFDLIQRMLKYEPSQRITMKEAMSHNFFSRIPTRRQLK